MSAEDARLFTLLEAVVDGTRNVLGVGLGDIDRAALGLDEDDVVGLVRRGLAEAFLREHLNEASLADLIAPVTLTLDGTRYVKAVREHRAKAIGNHRAEATGTSPTDPTEFPCRGARGLSVLGSLRRYATH